MGIRSCEHTHGRRCRDQEPGTRNQEAAASKIRPWCPSRHRRPLTDNPTSAPAFLPKERTGPSPVAETLFTFARSRRREPGSRNQDAISLNNQTNYLRSAVEPPFLPVPDPRLPNGGADRSRTDDLLNANQALSQLSYGPGRRGQDPGTGTQKKDDANASKLFPGSRVLIPDP